VTHALDAADQCEVHIAATQQARRFESSHEAGRAGHDGGIRRNGGIELRFEDQLTRDAREGRVRNDLTPDQKIRARALSHGLDDRYGQVDRRTLRVDGAGLDERGAHARDEIDIRHKLSLSECDLTQDTSQ